MSDTRLHRSGLSCAHVAVIAVSVRFSVAVSDREGYRYVPRNIMRVSRIRCSVSFCLHNVSKTDSRAPYGRGQFRMSISTKSGILRFLYFRQGILQVLVGCTVIPSKYSIVRLLATFAVYLGPAVLQVLQGYSAYTHVRQSILQLLWDTEYIRQAMLQVLSHSVHSAVNAPANFEHSVYYFLKTETGSSAPQYIHHCGLPSILGSQSILQVIIRGRYSHVFRGSIFRSTVGTSRGTLE